MRRGRADGGSATVLVLGLTAVLLLAGTVAALLGAVAVARHRAAAAADLAALAAAARVLDGRDAACAAAARAAGAAGAAVRSCRIEGWEAVVEAAVVPQGVIGALGTAVVTARAGPVRELSPATTGLRAGHMTPRLERGRLTEEA